MAYYGNEPWSAPARQPSWEQPPPQPPSRSGTASAGSREEPNAFAYQLAEVDKAIDNLMKSGKFPMLLQGPRRDSVPMMMGGRPGGYQEFDPRMGQMPRPGSMGGEFDGMRQQPNSNLQNFYANQRYGPRNSDADQQMQARRRQAAQRERELRNYHQEQQYQKHISGAKSDRSMSPNTGLNEDERRELIARQHRALYGNDSSLYTDNSRPVSQDARVSSMQGFGRGGSPLAYDPFGMQSQGNPGESAVQMPPRDQSQNKNAGPGAQRSRANSTSSPSSNQNPSFSLFENAQQSSRTSNSSPTGGSPPRDGAKATPTAGVAPIGTRPSQPQQQSGSTLQKRSTTPLPSPLSYGFTANDQSNNERSTSASSNPPSNITDSKPVGLGWGSNSGVWGASKNTLGVQASVWG